MLQCYQAFGALKLECKFLIIQFFGLVILLCNLSALVFDPQRPPSVLKSTADFEMTCTHTHSSGLPGAWNARCNSIALLFVLGGGRFGGKVTIINHRDVMHGRERERERERDLCLAMLVTS